MDFDLVYSCLIRFDLVFSRRLGSAAVDRRHSGIRRVAMAAASAADGHDAPQLKPVLLESHLTDRCCQKVCVPWFPTSKNIAGAIWWERYAFS